MRLEDALTPRGRVILVAFLERHGLDLRDWTAIEPLRLFFECDAVEAEADALERRQPELSRRGARRAACIRLGIDPDTYERRMREWRRISRSGVKRRTAPAA